MAFEFTDANFENSAENNKGVTLIDFWAEWCGPCLMIGPIVEELAKDYEGKALIGKMNVDSNMEVPQKFGVRAIPTIIILKDGNIFHKQVGATTKQVLQSKIEEAMAAVTA